MKVLEIMVENHLYRNLSISGAKNASVALIPAAILADSEVNHL